MMDFIERNNYSTKIIQAIKKVPIVLIIGARQVGKTTLIKNINFDKDVVFLNGQDPEDISLFEKNSTIEHWLKINLNESLDGFLIIDEFQFIADISVKLKILTDKNSNIKVICTGSSSLNILNNVRESLAGRIRIIEMYSLSFAEYLKFIDMKLFNEFTKYDLNTNYNIIKPEIKLLLNEYMIYGGFPRQAIEKKYNEKSEMLNDIYRTFLQKDVRQFIRNIDFVGFNKLLLMVALQIGNLLNINKLSNETGLSYKKTEEYLYILEQMYIIKLINPFYTNKRKVITKMKKVYFTDLGLRNIIIKDFKNIDERNDSGALFENYVLLELLKHSDNISEFSYYRTIDKSEIDFLINTTRKKILVEVKYKEFKQTKKFRNIESFKSIENPDEIYIINKSLNQKQNDSHFIPALLTKNIL